MVEGSPSIYKYHERFISGSKGFDITVLENYGRTGLGFKELRYRGIRGKGITRDIVMGFDI
jgi:hypothetical protein